MKPKQVRFRIRMPLVHFQKLTHVAMERNLNSRVPIVQEFLNWGFDYFCWEVAQVISDIQKPICLIAIFNLVFSGRIFTYGKLVSITPMLPVDYIKTLEKMASQIEKSALDQIELTFLISWYFRLEFDQYDFIT